MKKRNCLGNRETSGMEVGMYEEKKSHTKIITEIGRPNQALSEKRNVVKCCEPFTLIATPCANVCLCVYFQPISLSFRIHTFY